MIISDGTYVERWKHREIDDTSTFESIVVEYDLYESRHDHFFLQDPEFGIEKESRNLRIRNRISVSLETIVIVE
jgi:hypothetical protein